MKVQNVELGSIRQNGITAQNSNNYAALCKNKIVQDSFQYSFTGYNEALQEAVKSVIKNEREAKKIFKTLIKEVAEKDFTYKKHWFNDISEMYKKKGLRGLLYELWKTNPQENIAKLFKYKDYNNEYFVTQYGKPLFELVHMGKFGYSDYNPNDARLVFNNQAQNISIEFCLNKKGELKVQQSNLDGSITTLYHLSTGNKKSVVTQSAGGSIETTYYKKDGTKSFWQNLLKRGITIITQ